MTVDIAISIINYRTGDLTIQCAESVLSDLGPRKARVVIVDNASGDGSAEAIADWIGTHPRKDQLQLVRSATNSGFAGGHNQGFAAVEAGGYLVLNSDAVLRPGFFDELLAVADAHPDAGLVAPRLEGEDGTPQTSVFRFHSPASEFIRAANVGFVTAALKRSEVSLGPDPDPTQAEWASFACIYLRGDMIRAIGPMDEGYFLYYEDAEYCLRARRAGWKLVLAPRARAVHFRGGSGPVKALALKRERLPGYYYASRARFLTQAHGVAGLWAANILWQIGLLLRPLKRLIGRAIYPIAEGEAFDVWINALDPLGRRHDPRDRAS